MENTVKNNKLLAEFLEFEKVKFLNGCYTFIIPDYLSHGEYKNLTLEDNKEVVAWDVENLIFHKDWNWLMKVVEKILQICAEMDEMERYWCITDVMPYIDSVYTACVEFVKLYNAYMWNKLKNNTSS